MDVMDSFTVKSYVTVSVPHESKKHKIKPTYLICFCQPKIKIKFAKYTVWVSKTKLSRNPRPTHEKSIAPQIGFSSSSNGKLNSACDEPMISYCRRLSISRVVAAPSGVIVLLCRKVHHVQESHRKDARTLELRKQLPKRHLTLIKSLPHAS